MPLCCESGFDKTVTALKEDQAAWRSPVKPAPPAL